VRLPIGGPRRTRENQSKLPLPLPTPRGVMMELQWRHWPRFHMFLIVASAIAVALLVTQLMLQLGVAEMWVRYSVALAVAYTAFFVGVWVWLHLSKYGRYLREHWGRRDRSSLDGGGDVSLPDIHLPTADASAFADLPIQGGGSFDGGGAAGAWDVSPEPVSVDLPSEIPGGAVLDVADAGDEGGGLLVIAGILLVLALVIVFGGAAYVVYQAPAILAEVVFEVLLGSRLARGAMALDEAHWPTVLLRKTWKPFAVMAGAAMAFALFCNWAFPQVKSVGELLAVIVK
jgi:hypothetical protein